MPDLLKDPAGGVFYVFFDNNQRLYKQISNIPMETDPFYLDENCRNTQHIHAALQPYAHGEGETTCEGPEGRPVEIIPASDKQSTKRELQRVLHRLVKADGLRPEEIVVLTPASEKRSQWKENEVLGNLILTWAPETDMQDAIRVSTIYRFKGLESAVVVLTELDRRREEISDQLVYVGLSRPSSRRCYRRTTACRKDWFLARSPLTNDCFEQTQCTVPQALFAQLVWMDWLISSPSIPHSPRTLT